MVMRSRVTSSLALLLVCGALAGPAGAGQRKERPPPVPRAVAAAREKGLDWLTRNQSADGSWSRNGHSIAVTSFACLAYLSASDEPYAGARGKALVRGLRFLLANQKEGLFRQQGHTWIHGQGFATLALAEAYGRSLFCKTPPDLDMKQVRAVVAAAVRAIEKNQSDSGGWWYTPGAPSQHEGSTTVCAVQAVVAAANYGIATDSRVLDRGFDYLKRCQSPDGGFNYRLGDGTSMKEGTAADVATLALMQKFDFPVMIKGYQFLVKLTPAGISIERFPYYGHFYGCMGMQLLGQEYSADRSFREGTRAYIAGVQRDLLAWQDNTGAWPLKGWFTSGSSDDAGYATAFATLTLWVPEERLSIQRRTPPKLPGAGVKK
jgi:hypothetical protein